MTTKAFRETPKQREALALIKLCTHSLFHGGSRSGKTALICRTLLYRAGLLKSRHLIIRQTFSEARQSIGLETMPKVIDMTVDRGEIKLNKSEWFWTLPNGSEIWLAGLDTKERTEKVLGREFSSLFFNEVSRMTYDSVETVLSRLAENSGLNLKAMYDCNPPSSKHWAYQLWFEGLHPQSREELPFPEDYGELQMNPVHNPHLSSEYIDKILAGMTERKKKRFRDGIWQDDVEGALWNSDLIGAYRVQPHECPTFVRIVVGVDPAVTNNPNSEETGIVVAARGADRHFYILDDRSLKGSALAWAQAVVAAYKDNKGDRVIGEVNQGGDLVEVNLRVVDKTLPYKSVHASRGKYTRAEPVAARYEQGIVHHVGMFPDLELEMCSWDPVEGVSPNRLDALVWALTALGATIAPSVGSGLPAVEEDPRIQEIRDLISQAESDEEKAEYVRMALDEGIRL